VVFCREIDLSDTYFLEVSFKEATFHENVGCARTYTEHLTNFQNTTFMADLDLTMHRFHEMNFSGAKLHCSDTTFRGIIFFSSKF
jgi:hypothetical protein